MEIPIYVASPCGFSEMMRFFYHEKLLPMLNGLGAKLEPGYEVVVLDPWTNGGPPDTLAQAMDIGRANDDMQMHAKVVVAVLDGGDTGTGSETGTGHVRGQLVVGYYGDSRPAGDAPCLVTNLQVEYYIRASGGDIARSLEQLEEMLLRLIPRKYPLTRRP